MTLKLPITGSAEEDHMTAGTNLPDVGSHDAHPELCGCLVEDDAGSDGTRQGT